MTFADLHLITPLLKAVEEEGYTTPTPIQAQAIPGILEGRDVLGCAQTGTGKTAAFALPVLQRLADGPRPQGRRPIRTLVLAPTRELASQVGDSFRTYGRHTALRHTVIYGGVGQNPQVSALQRGVDIVVATPGRLLDLMNQGYVRLDQIEVLILDEADRMLDMGFMPDIKRIVGKIPNQRQTLLFSATMPDEIRHFSRNFLTDPLHVSVAPVATPAERIEQSLYFVEKENKGDLLLHLLDNIVMPRVLVFSRTKHGADRIVKKLNRSKVTAEAIHGNKSQSKREFALRRFKQGKVQVLVATDIASRGLDIDEVSHVLNYDLPNDTDSYVHRIGRTARAGASGTAIAFCAKDEHGCLRDIQQLINFRIPVVDEHPYRSEYPAPVYVEERPGRSRSKGGYGARGSSNSRGQGGSRGQGSSRGNRGSRKPWERDSRSGGSGNSGGRNRNRRPHRKGQSSAQRAESHG